MTPDRILSKRLVSNFRGMIVFNRDFDAGGKARVRLRTCIAERIRGEAGSKPPRTPTRAVWNGAVLAESDAVVKLEGNHYFPPDSLYREYFLDSKRKSVCPWKGLASYYTVEVDGERNDAAAWTYRHPSPLARKIKDHVSFSQGVEVVRAE